MDERNIFLKGQFVNLVILTESDVINSNWYGWFNDSDTTINTQKHYYPNTLQNQLDYYKSIQNNPNIIQLGIVEKNGSELFGIVSLSNINFINRNADISLIIGEKKYRKLLYSDEALKLIFDHAFFTLNLHKIIGGYVHTLETWGKFLKNRFGFTDEGIWREHVYKNGTYLNIIRLGLLKSEYIKKQNIKT